MVMRLETDTEKGLRKLEKAIRQLGFSNMGFTIVDPICVVGTCTCYWSSSTAGCAIHGVPSIFDNTTAK